MIRNALMVCYNDVEEISLIFQLCKHETYIKTKMVADFLAGASLKNVFHQIWPSLRLYNFQYMRLKCNKNEILCDTQLSSELYP